MRRERLRDAAFIAVIAIVLVVVVANLKQKADDCSARGGSLEFRGVRFIGVDCHLPDGTTISM